jgi:transcriptional regulator with XRE-family HTH domain
MMGSHMKDITPTQEVSPLRAARDRKGMTREELAFRAHVSAKTIERLERSGEATPHRVTQRAIADVLGCEPSDLWQIEAAA